MQKFDKNKLRIGARFIGNQPQPSLIDFVSSGKNAALMAKSNPELYARIIQNRKDRALKRFNRLKSLNRPIPAKLQAFISSNGLGELPEDILQERGDFHMYNDDNLENNALLNSGLSSDMAQSSRQIDEVIKQHNGQVKRKKLDNYFNVFPINLDAGNVQNILPYNEDRKYLRIYNDSISADAIYVIFNELGNETGNFGINQSGVKLAAGQTLEFNQVIPVNGITIHYPVGATAAIGNIIEA